jgi:hypothetical protein
MKYLLLAILMPLQVYAQWYPDTTLRHKKPAVHYSSHIYIDLTIGAPSRYLFKQDFQIAGHYYSGKLFFNPSPTLELGVGYETIGIKQNGKLDTAPIKNYFIEAKRIYKIGGHFYLTGGIFVGTAENSFIITDIPARMSLFSCGFDIGLEYKIIKQVSARLEITANDFLYISHQTGYLIWPIGGGIVYRIK